nr:recombinase family protein [Mesorhizobium sp.]
MGRSLSHLIRIVEELKALGIASGLSEAMDTTNSHGAFLFNLFGSLAEYERV